MAIGSIDLVWYTTEKDCVLVDFKNLPNAGIEVLNPENKEYLGHYAPQQRAYKIALTRSALNVKACIIYMSMQGKVISISF